jgi:alpha-ribazole phosphatase
LLVQHGGTMRLLLTLLFNRPIAAMSRLVVPYGCLMRLKVWHLPNRDYVFLMPHKKGE